MGQVWQVFLDLHAARSSNGFGANPLSYMEIEAMSRMSGVALSQLDMQALRSIDTAWMGQQQSDQQRDQQHNKKHQ